LLRKNLLALGILMTIVIAAWIVQTWRDRRLVVSGWLALIVVCIVVLLLALTIHFASARDLGQWNEINNDQTVRQWFKTLMRPDFPDLSCCGEADAYWCDDIRVVKGHTSCAITDDRPDEPRGRPHVEIGTVIDIPDEKLKWDRGNPTGHAIVFMGGGYGMRYVFCFVQPGGV